MVRINFVKSLLFKSHFSVTCKHRLDLSAFSLNSHLSKKKGIREERHSDGGLCTLRWNFAELGCLIISLTMTVSESIKARHVGSSYPNVWQAVRSGDITDFDYSTHSYHEEILVESGLNFAGAFSYFGAWETK